MRHAMNESPTIDVYLFLRSCFRCGGLASVVGRKVDVDDMRDSSVSEFLVATFIDGSMSGTSHLNVAFFFLFFVHE